MDTIPLFAHCTDTELVTRLDDLARKERRSTAELVSALEELDVVTSIRKWPMPKAAEPPVAPPLPPAAQPVMPLRLPSQLSVVAPLAPERFKIQITVNRTTHDTLRELQNLMRHAIPSGDAAEIISRALRLLLEDVKRRKFAAVNRPRARGTRPAGAQSASASRHIPSDVKRAVSARDKGRCAFKGPEGRCEARTFLEFHHVTPFAAGGNSGAANIELRCRAHNAHEAELFFGTRYPKAPTEPDHAGT